MRLRVAAPPPERDMLSASVLFTFLMIMMFVVAFFADPIFDCVRAHRTDPIPAVVQIPEIHWFIVNLECWHFHIHVFIILHQIVPKKEHIRHQTERSEWKHD